MFAFGANLAQALMKYSRIDPPTADPREADIWSLFHWLTPRPLFSRIIVPCLRFKAGHAQESGHRGSPSRQVALVVHVSNQLEPKKADVSLDPGEVLRAAFRG